MSSNDNRAARHTAGALDIRNIIGGLMGVFGVVILVTGLVATADPGTSETSNVVAGLILIVFGLVFLAWARLKPVVVPEDVHAADVDGMEKPPGT